MCWSAALADRHGALLTVAVAASVAVAFADSSIVVLALPDLYGEFDTSIVGVAWVITSYNLVVAVVAAGWRRSGGGSTPAAAAAGRRSRSLLVASIGCAAARRACRR